jgi:hypothetical protein
VYYCIPKWVNGVDFMMYSHMVKAPNDTQLEILWVKTIPEAESDY